MRSLLKPALFVLFATVTAACASSGSAVRPVSQSVGTASRGDLDETLRQVLARNQYVLEREILETNMTYETRWRARAPFDDERELGATQAETRIVVNARPRSREANIYTVNMTVENRLMMGSGDWETLAPTPEFRTYAQSIVNELSRELLQGIRVR